MAGGHRCHAFGCAVLVPRAMLMCRGHWFSLPKHLRDEVWRTYRVGQESGFAPVSPEWHAAADAAIKFIAAKEGKR